VIDFGTSKSPKLTRQRDSRYALTALRTSRFRIAHTNAVKGLSALQMFRNLGVQYKTAFVLRKINHLSDLRFSYFETLV